MSRGRQAAAGAVKRRKKCVAPVKARGERRRVSWHTGGHVSSIHLNSSLLMATLADRLSLNVAGRFYVDSSCIDCDQCRTEAPDFFARDADTGSSYVQRQPVTAEEIELVQQVANNCATNSIGDEQAG